jgi:hypothetical protein
MLSGWRLGVRVCVGVLVLAMSAGPARASCPSGPDTDGDGVCDAVDNCVAVPNADQADTYGASSSSPAGAFGDACEAIDAELNLTKVKIRSGAVTTTPKGKITVAGDFVLLASETFAPPSIAVRVVDGLMLDESGPVPSAPSICTASTSGRVVKCKQASKQPSYQTTAKFKFPVTTSGPRVIRYTLKVLKLPIGGQAFSEPVTVTLFNVGSGIDRVGIIHDCAATNGQLTCREL